MPEHAAALRAQLAYLERASPFWRERLGGRAAHPPFGARLCAPPAALVRVHVTSGTTGEPVAIGLTRRDHEANSAIGAAAFAIAGVREI